LFLFFVFVSYVSYLMSFVIWVSLYCCVCNEPLDLWLSTLINNNWIIIVIIIIIINVLLGSKSCSSTMDIIGLRVPTRNLRDFPLFHVISSYKNCPSGRCATAANLACKQLDVFRRQIVTLSQMWYYCTTLLQGVLINNLSIPLFVCLFWLCWFHLSPVHCPLLFVFVCCAVSVIGHLAVGSAHQ
jgi:hypothetical protein